MVGLSALLGSYLLIIWIVLDCTFGSGAVLVSTIGVGGFSERVTDLATILLTVPFVMFAAKGLFISSETN
jgi:hypothetical protein